MITARRHAKKALKLPAAKVAENNEFRLNPGPMATF
jgi:hypothetical protein